MKRVKPLRKKCASCQRVKKASSFAENLNLKSGLDSYCYPCRLQYKKDYYKKNRKHILERSKIYQANNYEQVLKKHKEYYKRPDIIKKQSAYQVKYYAKNKERMLKYAKDYQNKHKEQLRINALKFYYKHRERLLAERKEKRRKLK